MATRPFRILLAVCLVVTVASAARAQQPNGRHRRPDSFAYYGPGGLYRLFQDPSHQAERLGRDTWMFFTGGNQFFLRQAAVLASKRNVSVDFFRLLDSRHRADRFKDLGLINEPNCVLAKQPDEYGFWLDEALPDPENHYPGQYSKQLGLKSPLKEYYAHLDENTLFWYGYPTGVVGLRKFKNPNFTDKDDREWKKNKNASVRAYFDNPGAKEPPWLIGFSCAFCHMGFDPTNPPANPAEPRWDNLAANIGNQYFREGELIFTKGRVILGMGNAEPRPGAAPADPYDATGRDIDERSFLFHYAVTQQPGTSETSRISYDFINNPNTINPIFNLLSRRQFLETMPDGSQQWVNHILKDGADSVGIHKALMRVWVNIGMEGHYWVDHLYNPVTEQRQNPVDIEELRLNPLVVKAERLRELKTKYQAFGVFWREAETRNPSLIAYLATYRPLYLASAPGGGRWIDVTKLAQGRQVFADHCARCHSSKQPLSLLATDAERKRFYRALVDSPNFLEDNNLSDDVRHRATDPELDLNLGRALATNAVDGDVWAQFSSKDYKALAPLGRVHLDIPVIADQARVPFDFVPPGGGRGYYRTASLINMWATAPYLHNNSVGDYWVVTKRDEHGNVLARKQVPNDGTRILGEIDVSVEGRMRMFQDGVEKLLWPVKRRMLVKRTSHESSFIELLPMMRGSLEQTVDSTAFDLVKRQLAHNIHRVVTKENAPESIEPLLNQLVARKLVEYRDKMRRQFTKDAVREALLNMEKELEPLLDKVLADDPKVPDPTAAAGAGGAKELVRKAFKRNLDTLTRFDLLDIPAKTPVNLFANLRHGTALQALRVHAQYRDFPEQWAAELLKLSECPDLEEDRGHYYGAGLRDDEKLALIEFLKTL